MKFTKLFLAAALLIASIDFAEAARITLAPANATTNLQLPPPPPPPGLPRFGRRRRFVRHRRVVRHRRSFLGIYVPPPPRHPPRPRF